GADAVADGELDGDATETSLYGFGYYDVFVAKYEPDGTLAWATNAGGSNVDDAFTVAAAPDGSALVAGYIASSATFGAGEPGETTLTSAGGLDVFVARYAP
ncbi:MAG: hypothetical protein AABZ30_13035, partial [Myxococcota bacterium]